MDTTGKRVSNNFQRRWAPGSVSLTTDWWANDWLWPERWPEAAAAYGDDLFLDLDRPGWDQWAHATSTDNVFGGPVNEERAMRYSTPFTRPQSALHRDSQLSLAPSRRPRLRGEPRPNVFSGVNRGALASQLGAVRE